MNRFFATALAGFACLATAHASVTLITFGELGVGTVLSNQYAAQGVTFSANAIGGTGWATNTDMTIVRATGSHVLSLGLPNLASGNLLHSYSGWLHEVGDASFAIDFLNPVAFVSLDFAGVTDLDRSQLFLYDGANLLSTVVGLSAGQFTLGYSHPHTTRAVVTPGHFGDWAGIDNLRFSPADNGNSVPEPATWALAGVGRLAALAIRRRKSRAQSA